MPVNHMLTQQSAVSFSNIIDITDIADESVVTYTDL